jgi:hypothetical protein
VNVIGKEIFFVIIKKDPHTRNSCHGSIGKHVRPILEGVVEIMGNSMSRSCKGNDPSYSPMKHDVGIKRNKAMQKGSSATKQGKKKKNGSVLMLDTLHPQNSFN